MDKQDLINLAANFVDSSADNLITEHNAISESVVGLKLFGAPILAFGDVYDEYFRSLKAPNAIGQHFLLPQEWLPLGKTVISFFLPFTKAVKESNQRDFSWPSAEWLHGRIEGQGLINNLCRYLSSELIKAGYASIVPILDARFWANTGQCGENGQSTKLYTSNWSERHAAYICGLGTFGLSKGLITPKGMAGRLGSIITQLALAPDQRKYTRLYEYCSMCGACGKNCPVNAISLDRGKIHRICGNFVDQTAEKFSPRYGCGKCQVRVPCENGIPRQ